MKRTMNKISSWIQFPGLIALAVILFVCFPGKEDDTMDRFLLFGLMAAVAVYVISNAASTRLNGAGIQFIMYAVLCIGILALAMLKGYGSEDIKDCGTYSFKAVKFWQEKHTTRIRHRSNTSFSNYVEYQAFLDNGDEVNYKHTTSSIGDAMSLVQKADTKKRQVFYCNNRYYTGEPGAGPEDFLDGFLKWKRILPIAAAVYAVPGFLLLLAGKRSPNENTP